MVNSYELRITTTQAKPKKKEFSATTYYKLNKICHKGAEQNERRENRFTIVQNTKHSGDET